jgi:hypothetical protein
MRQIAAASGAEPRLLYDPCHGRIMLDQRDLAGNLEGLGRDRRARIEPEHAADRVEAAQPAAIRVALPCPRLTAGADHHAHPVAALDVVGQRLEADTAAFRQILAQRLASEVEFVNVVVDIVEEVADLFIGRRLAQCARAFQCLVEFGELVAGSAHGLMQRQEGTGKGRGVLHHQLDVGQRWLRPAGDRIGERLGDIGKQPVTVLVRQGGNIDGEGFGQRQQHRSADMALVVLDLIEIAGRDAKLLREAGLGQAVFSTDGADLAADEELA